MRKLRITPEAESDLTGIWLYTCVAWSPEQADKYLDQLEVGIKQLLSHPLLGADYSHVRTGYRRLKIKHHAVFYQTLEAEVLIVRVLHEEMDASKRIID